MTQNHSPTGRGGQPDAVDLGPTTESLARILAELRDITQQADSANQGFQPLEPTSATSMRRAVRFGVPAAKSRWPVRIAIGGGALVLAGVLALPLSGSLFPSEPTTSVDLAATSNDGVPDASKPAAAIETASGDLGSANQKETASLLQTPPPEPVRTSGLQHAVSAGEAPMSTASIAPPVPRPERSVPLPVVELPEPLAAKDFSASPTIAALPGSTAEPSEIVESAPSSGSSSAGTRIASLGDVAVLPAPPALSLAQTATLLNRAQEMVLNRDISSARLILEKALSGGSAEAAFNLAETYDPRMLEAWNVRGIDGDPARAKELYSRASQAGNSAAGERLIGLEEIAR
jgi:hypothetical protein